MTIFNKGAGKAPIQCCKGTDEFDTSSAVVDHLCAFYGITLTTDYINDVTLNIYDNASLVGGKKLIPQRIVKADEGIFNIFYAIPKIAYNGVYVSCICSGIYKYTVEYDD